jgi:hypothetical protein
MGWNGKDFVDELSAKLSDETTSFKTKVLGWLNDGVKDIASRHEWTFTRVLGRKTLTPDLSTQDISLGQPSAPTLALSAGGSLVENSVYKVLVTFYEASSKNESMAGIESASVTGGAVNKTIDVTAIPVSSDGLVTSRRIYLSVDGAAFFYHGEIANNTATTYSISTETTTDVTPPSEHSIRCLDGSPFIIGSKVLDYMPLHQILSGSWSSLTAGTPDVWSNEQEEKLYLYPKPSTAIVLSYYYFKIPNKSIYSISSLIDIPEWLKPDLEAYVTWRGYDYRDRDGKQEKRNNFEDSLNRTISQKGAQKKVARRVSDKIGDSDGWLI